MSVLLPEVCVVIFVLFYSPAMLLAKAEGSTQPVPVALIALGLTQPVPLALIALAQPEGLAEP